jgi:hypothetical protein
MNNKTFLTIHSAIYVVFALALFIVPQTVWPIYGVELNDPYAYLLSQHTSIFLGGIGVISYQLRDIGAGQLAKKLFFALLISNVLGVVVTLYAGITGILTGLGWSDPAFFALLSIMSYLQCNKQ